MKFFRRFWAMLLAVALVLGNITFTIPTVQAIADETGDESTVLVLDTEYSVSFEDGGSVSFSFTPTETGRYVFTSYNNTGDPSAYLYDALGTQLSYNDDGRENYNFLLSYTLTAGEKYYYSATSTGSASSYTVKLYACKTIENISVVSVPADEYEKYDAVSMIGAVLKLTYTDGFESELTLTSSYTTDPYSTSVVRYRIYNDSTGTYSTGGSRLTVGTYSVYFYSGSIQSEVYPITVSEPSSVTELVLDTEYSVSVSYGVNTWFSYTPETTGRYVFESSDYSGNTSYVYLYEEDNASYLSWTAFSSYGTNYGAYELEAGKTYYIKALCSSSDYSATYTASLSACKTIETIEVESLSTESFEWRDYAYFVGTVLNITYTDGATAELSFNYDGTVDPDSRQSIYYTIYDEAGDSVSKSSMDVGNYTVEFYSGSIISEASAFTVSMPSEITELEVGTSYDVTLSEGVNAWFTYTPETTGTYSLDSSNDTDYYYSELYLYDEDGYLTSTQFGYNGLYLAYTLEAGTTYYFKATLYEYDEPYTTSFSVSLYECKDLESISITSLPADDYEWFTSVSMIGAELTLTYTDGSTGTLTQSSTRTVDSTSKSTIRYYIYDANGDYVTGSSSTLTEGTYTVVFYTGDIQSAAGTFTVTKPSDITELTLGTEYSVSVSYETNKWFSFTPETSGRYLFESMNYDGEYPIVYLYDDSSRLTYNSFGTDDDNFSLAYTLEAGTTYYYKTTCYNYGMSYAGTSVYSVVLSELKTIDSIAVSSLSTTDFEWRDSVSFTGSVLNITYTDGSTAELSVTSDEAFDSNSRQYIYYSIYNEAGNSVSYSHIDVGTYTVVFYSGDITSAATTFTVSMPSSITVLDLDTSYDVSLSYGVNAWFSYTPETTGTYSFDSLCDEDNYDTYVRLYGEDGYLTSASMGYNGAYLAYTLEAGTTYYFKAGCYSYYDETNIISYSVSLSLCKEIAGISIASLPAETYEWFTSVSMVGSTLTLTYADGTTGTLTQSSTRTTDSISKQTIRYYIYDASGSYVTGNSSTLAEGNYTVVFYTGDITSEPYAFTVSRPENMTELVLDTDYGVTLTGTAGVWFSYTPEVTGTYAFESFDCTSGDPYGYLYTESGRLSSNDDGGTGSNFLVTYTLEAGTTYYFKAYYYSSYSLPISYSVKLYEIKNLASISVVSLPAEDYEWFSYVNMEGAVLQLTYDDESTSELTITSSSTTDSSSKESIYYRIYNENGGIVDYDYDRLVAGTYTVVFYSSSLQTEPYTFTVSAPESITALALDTEYSVDVTYGNNVWFSFTPEESGKYVFESINLTDDSEYPYVQLYDESSYLTYNRYGSDGSNFLLAYALEAGKTYYYMTSCYDWGISSADSSSFSVHLYRAKDIESISVISLPSDDYEWFTTVSLTGAVLQLTYTDGSTSEFTMSGSSTTDSESRESIYYYIYDESGEYASEGYTSLTAGTYTVVFYSNSAQSDACSFTVSVPDDITELEIGTEYSVSITTSGEKVWFSFTPEEAANYTFASDLTSGDPYVYLYDENGRLSSNDDGGDGRNFLLTYAMEAGKTYYFAARAYNYSTAEYTATLYRTKTIESMSVVSLPEEFDTATAASMSGAVLSLTYTDESTSEITIYSNPETDVESNTRIYYSIYNADGNVVSTGSSTLSAGTYTVQFYLGSDSTITASSTFIVVQAKANQNLTASYASSIESGNTNQITITGAVGTLTYISSNENVLTVSDTGLVTAVGAGTAVVTVTASGDDTTNSASIDLTITVTGTEQTVSVSVGSSSLTCGGTTQITVSGVGDITYSSSDTSVATVSSTGLVTAVGAGTATITVTAAGNSSTASDSTTVVITVTKATQNLTAIYTSSLESGSTSQITITGAVGTLTYSSSNENVLTVSSTGLMTAVNAGTATVTVTAAETATANSASKVFTITVTGAEQTVSASVGSSSLTCGGTTQITVSGVGDITYSSSDTSVATVSSTGLVTAVGAGTATITITAAGNASTESATQTIEFTVTEAAPEYVLGDVNEDGEINYLDAMQVLRYDAELTALTDSQLLAGDVNGDGSVNSLDAILILRYDAGLITSF